METIGADLAEMKPVPLAAAHVEAIRAIGGERSYAAGDMIARLGDPMDHFLYVVEGEIEGARSLSETRMPATRFWVPASSSVNSPFF